MKTKYFVGIIGFVVMILFFAGKDKTTKKEEKYDLKKLEKSMAKVTNKLYACKFEATNLEYRIFLNELKTTNQKDLFKQSLIDSNGWKKDINYTNDPPEIKYYHTHKAYNNYPVVNITAEGATNFCKWLTDKYNSYPKRKYKKVIFRLPTEKEWIRAAKDSLLKTHTTYYPLFIDNLPNCNFQIINQKNIYKDIKTKELFIKYDTLTEDKKAGKYYLGKYLLSDTMHDIGMWSSSFVALYDRNLPLPVNSYKPNSLGIYNMFGNAAEMIQEKGRTKGGCYESTGYFLNPFSVDEFKGFNGSSIYIGFRYFMEVIEK